MTDHWFPRKIKPLTSKNYSTSRGGNVALSSVAGGMPRIGLGQTIESPTFSLNFILTAEAYAALLNFYDVVINHGAESFKMNLDGGGGVEEHQCTIKPGTFKAVKPEFNKWYVAMSVIADSTSSQLHMCDNYSGLYDCYGDDLKKKIICPLEQFIKGIPID